MNAVIEEAHPDEEVDHEEDVEGEVYLLRGVGGPGHAGLHCVTGMEDCGVEMLILKAQKPHKATVIAKDFPIIAKCNSVKDFWHVMHYWFCKWLVDRNSTWHNPIIFEN